MDGHQASGSAKRAHDGENPSNRPTKKRLSLSDLTTTVLPQAPVLDDGTSSNVPQATVTSSTTPSAQKGSSSKPAKHVCWFQGFCGICIHPGAYSDGKGRKRFIPKRNTKSCENHKYRSLSLSDADNLLGIIHTIRVPLSPY
jgi:hypothetical protein